MRWSREEQEILTLNYPSETSLKELSKKLGKSIKSIKHKAARLSLSRGKTPVNKPKIPGNRKIVERKYYEKNKFRIYNNKILRLKNKKEELIKQLGGKCKICSYCKCNSALEFHHKKDNLSKIIKNLSKQDALKKAKNCILLCANGHRELHMGS